MGDINVTVRPVSQTSAIVNTVTQKVIEVNTLGGGGATVDLTPYLQRSETGILSNEFFPRSSGELLIAGSSVAGVSHLNGATGALSLTGKGNVTITIDGTTLSISGTSGDTSNFVLRSETGHNHDASYYPRTGNPSGYLTSIDSGVFALKSDTGNFVTTSQTGHNHDTQYYPLNSNPEGYLTAFDSGVYALKSETGHNHDSQYYPKTSNPSGYVTGNVVRPTETGDFTTVSYVQGASGHLQSEIDATGSYLSTLIQASNAGVSSLNGLSGTVSLTGAGNITVISNGQTITLSGSESSGDYVSRSETGNFVTTSQTGHNHDDTYYPRSSNPSGYLTSFDSGVFALKADTGNFVTTNQTGHNHDTQYYPRTSNPSGYVTGSVVRPNETGNFITANQTGHNHDSDYYPRTSNPSGYLTGFNSGLYALKSETGHNHDNQYYPSTSNPSGYVTGNVVRPSDTGNFVTTAQTGHNHNDLYYPLNNPSGFITGVNTGDFVTTSQLSSYVQTSQTGAFLTSFEKSMFLELPVVGDRIAMFKVPNTVTLKKVTSVVFTTGAAPSLTYKITQAPTRNSISGVVLGSSVETNETTGTLYNSFDTAIITGGNYVFFECSAVSNTANIHLTLEF